MDAAYPLVPGAWTWSKVYTCGNVPGPRHVCASVVYNNALWIYAGYGWKSCYLNDLFKFSFDTNEWQQINFPKSCTPPESHSMSSVLYGDKLVLFGGIGNGITKGDLYTLDFATLQWTKIDATGDLPTPRWGHTAVVHNDKMYVFGGYVTSFTNDLYELDLRTFTWHKPQTVGQPPKPRQFHAAFVYNDAMYIMGGFTGHVNSNEIFTYHFATRTWTRVALKSGDFSARRGHTAVVYKNCAYIFGGKGATALNDLLEFNLDTLSIRQISVVGDLPSPRHFHSCCIWNNALYIFGGLSRNNLNDMYKFTFEPENVEHTYSVDFKALFDNELFSDVTFVVEGKEIRAHKCLLYASSEHFRGMFGGGLKESHEQKVEIQDVSYSAFKAMLEYIYTNRPTITPDNVVELLICGDKYLLPKLADMCEDVLYRMVTVDNAKTLLQVAKLHQRKKLLSRCEEVLKEVQNASSAATADALDL